MPNNNLQNYDSLANGTNGKTEKNDSFRKGTVIQYCAHSPRPSSERGRIRQRRRLHGGEITRALRIATNVAALASNFLFSGIIFGWAPLKLILLREGEFSHLCRFPQDVPCTAQLDRYNLIFTLAQFFLSFASLPVGFFLDKAPKTIHYTVAGVLQISGLLLFAHATAEHDHFFDLGYTLMAIGGCMTMLGSFPASFLLPHHQPAILAAISCLFDASSVVFTVFSQLHKYNAVVFSRFNMFCALAVIGVFVYTTLIYCWYKLEGLNWEQVIEEEEDKERQTTSAEDTSARVHSEADALHSKRIEQLQIHDQPVLRQLLSYDYTLAVLFASVHMLRCNFYLETVNEMLSTFGDKDAFYANIFSFVLPAGIVFVPVIEFCVRRLGVIGTLNLTNMGGVLFGVLLLVPVLRIQMVNFALFACFRAFLYATLNTFIAFTFGVRTMGRIIGFVFTTAAVVTLLQYPAAGLAESPAGTDFTFINGVMVSICVIPIALSLAYSQLLKNDHGETAASSDEHQPLL